MPLAKHKRFIKRRIPTVRNKEYRRRMLRILQWLRKLADDFNFEFSIPVKTKEGDSIEYGRVKRTKKAPVIDELPTCSNKENDDTPHQLSNELEKNSTTMLDTPGCSKDQTEVASVQPANHSETAKTSQKVRTITQKRPKSQMKPRQVKPIVIPELPPIINLPGKKEAVPKANLPLAKDSTCQNPNCGVVFGSEADKKLDTQHGVNNMAIGCDAMDCEHWVHVRCAGKRVTDVGELEHIELFCPLHDVKNKKTRAKRAKRK